MATEVRLAQLGQTMEEGTITGFMIKVGDEVKKGDAIFEVETDKAVLEVESPAEGFVRHIAAEVGATLLVGDLVLVLGREDEDVSTDAAKSPAADSPAVAVEPTTAPAKQPAEQSAESQPAGKVKASPRAKRLAKELGVSLAAVTPTGPGGRITEQDIEKAAESTPAKAAAATVEAGGEVKLGQTIPLGRLQKITGQKMLQSKQEIPCFYLSVKADVTDIVALRTKLNESGETKVSFNDFIIKAVAVGLEKFPLMTGRLADDKIELAETINIGLAIALPDGLVAPILKDVRQKSVAKIAGQSQAIIEKARQNKLSPDDLEGGCITVSNLGAFGVDSFIPIVVPGQASILGVGRIAETCVPDNGEIAMRKLMSLTLSVDHKVNNGAYAAQFLDFTRKVLEDTSNFA